jgi:2-aminoadipate transaminase
MEARTAEVELRELSQLFAARTRGGAGGAIAELLAITGRADVISFAGGIPDPETLPGEALAEILRDLALARDERAFQYGPTEGLASMREYLTERVAGLEGQRPEPGELLVTSGGVEALELHAKAFVDEGDVVVVEAPTYLGAIMSFEAYGARLVGVPLDDDGLDPEALERELRAGLRPKLLYTIPEYQNPAGVTLSAERREALVELARRYGFLIVEDVAYRELGFEDGLLPSLWSQAPDTVVQIGTFSKIFMPGTRLGWACGPRDVVEQLAWAKQTTDQCASGLAQRLAEEYGRRGLLEEGIRRSRAFYARRWALTSEALERHLAGKAEWTKPRGGFFTWLTLPDGDTTALSRAALDRGFAFVPGSPFFPDGQGGRNLRLAFSRVADEKIDEGIRRLAELLSR